MAAIVGLDIGSRGIKAIALEGSAKRLRVSGFAHRELALGATPEAVRAAVGEALQSLFSKGGGRERVVVALPSYEAAVRELTLPFTDDARIRATIKPEAEPLLPFPMEQMVLDYVRVGQSDGKTNLVVCAVRKELISSTLATLNEHNVDPVKLDLDVSGVLNAAVQSGAVPPDGTALLVDVGWTATRLALVVGGQVRQLRGFRAGMGSMLSEVASATGKDAEDAQTLIESAVRGQPEPDENSRAALEKAIAGVAERLAKETRRFLATVTGEVQIAAALVTGGASRLPQILEALSQASGAQATPLGIFANLPHSLDAATAETAARLGAVALGMALEEVGFDQARINLRQEEFAYRSGFERIRTPLTLCLFVVLILFGSLGYYMHRQATAAARGAAETTYAIREVWRVAGFPARPMMDIVRDLRARLQSIRDAGGAPTQDELAGLDFWLEVVKTFPEDPRIVYQNFSVTGSQCRVRGTVPDFDSWTKVLDAFTKSTTVVASPEPIYSLPDGSIQFYLRINKRGGSS